MRICKPGGYVVVAVPHEVYYEKNKWPSPFNDDHKASFRLEQTTVLPKSIWVQEFLQKFPNIEVVSIGLVLLNFDYAQFWSDQTRGAAVCHIEFVLRKK